MVPCPECKSTNIYQYDKAVELPGAGGELIPKLGKSMFSTAKILPTVCLDCGYIRHYATSDVRKKLKTSRSWKKI